MIESISVSTLFKEEIENNLFKLYEEESRVEEAPLANPNIEVYKTLEDSGMLTISGLYQQKELLGFCIITYAYLTHSNSTIAIVDSFFVHPEFRKYGMGKKLLNYAEKTAQEKGALVITMTSPYDSRLSKVANSFGYRTTNLIHSKKLV